MNATRVLLSGRCVEVSVIIFCFFALLIKKWDCFAAKKQERLLSMMEYSGLFHILIKEQLGFAHKHEPGVADERMFLALITKYLGIHTGFDEGIIHLP
jgi:hypothetical protein